MLYIKLGLKKKTFYLALVWMFIGIFIKKIIHFGRCIIIYDSKIVKLIGNYTDTTFMVIFNII